MAWPSWGHWVADAATGALLKVQKSIGVNFHTGGFLGPKNKSVRKLDSQWSWWRARLSGLGHSMYYVTLRPLRAVSPDHHERKNNVFTFQEDPVAIDDPVVAPKLGAAQCRDKYSNAHNERDDLKLRS